MHLADTFIQSDYSALIQGPQSPWSNLELKRLAEGHTGGDDCGDGTSKILLTSSLHHKVMKLYQKLACNCKHMKLNLARN